MKFGRSSEVPAQDVSQVLPGTKGLFIQWLVTKDDGSDRIAFFTAPFEPHSIENPGDEEAVFVCAITYEDDMSLQPVEQGA